jgi:acetyl-CoA acetyltransferase
MPDAVIVDAVRTASDKRELGGALSGVHPVDLLATAPEGVLERNGLDPALVDDVICGCVTQAGEQSLTSPGLKPSLYDEGDDIDANEVNEAFAPVPLAEGGGMANATIIDRL